MDQSNLHSLPWDELGNLPINPVWGRMGLKVFTITQTLEDLERRLACSVDQSGNRNEAEAVLAACREEMTRLAEQVHMVKD